MVLSLAIAAAAFHMMTLETGGQLIEGVVYEAKWVNLMLGMMVRGVCTLRTALLTLAQVLYIASYALALGAIPWHSSELYPEEQRAVGASILTSANWSGMWPSVRVGDCQLTPPAQAPSCSAPPSCPSWMPSVRLAHTGCTAAFARWASSSFFSATLRCVRPLHARAEADGLAGLGIDPRGGAKPI